MSEGVIRSDAEIFELIKCDKSILRKPPSQKETNRDLKRKFDVISMNSSLEFEVFFAQNIRLPNDFSIGLMHGKFLLIRYNGFHGTTNAGFHKYGHHAYVHSHMLTLEDILNGRETNPSRLSDMTGSYFDFESAQLFFLKECNVVNYDEYFNFSKYNQMSFADL